MGCFNVIKLEPSKTYASAANAEKAVTKWADRAFGGTNALVFNVIMMTTAEGRFYPLLCNINKEYFHIVIHSGFNCVN